MRPGWHMPYAASYMLPLRWCSISGAVWLPVHTSTLCAVAVWLAWRPTHSLSITSAAAAFVGLANPWQKEAYQDAMLSIFSSLSMPDTSYSFVAQSVFGPYRVSHFDDGAEARRSWVEFGFNETAMATFLTNVQTMMGAPCNCSKAQPGRSGVGICFGTPVEARPY